jgi:hypothetical protein
LCVPVLKDVAFARVLYHELGHHIHTTLQPEHGEREDVAEEWGRKLTRSFVRRKYWYLLPLVVPLRVCFSSVIWVIRRILRVPAATSRRVI